MKLNELSDKIAETLPEKEKYNLSSQLRRALTSIVLNIAEGSTGQSDNEQIRFLRSAIRSYIEVIACIRLIQNKKYLPSGNVAVQNIERTGYTLFGKLQAFKKALE